MDSMISGGAPTPRAQPTPGGHEHAVQFYERDEALISVVADYLAGGHEAHDALVVIATEAHRKELAERLRARGCDVDGDIASGKLKLLDAQAMLAEFMVGDAPSWPLFRATIERALFGAEPPEQQRVRAYGEMVDVLWRSGNPDAAVRLEEMWNDLQELHSFSLLCTYAVASFLKKPGDLGRVAQRHDQVAGASGSGEGAPGEGAPAGRLELEIAQREEVERALRGCVRRLRASEAEADRTHRQAFTVLSGFSRAFAEAGSDLRALLAAVVEVVCAEYADACAVSLVTPQGGLKLTAAQHRKPETRAAVEAQPAASPLVVGEALWGPVVITGQPVLVSQVDPALLSGAAEPEHREALAALMPSSVVMVPLRTRSEIIGVLSVQRERDAPPLVDRDLRLIEELAERTAMAIENCRLHADNARGRARAEILHGLAGAVNQAQTRDEVFDAALLALDSALGARRSAILTFDPDGVMRFKAWRGLSEAYRTTVEGHSPWAADAKTFAPILVSDVTTEPAVAAFLPAFRAENIGAVGFIPLVSGGKLLGKFMVYYEGVHPYTADERETATVIANHVAAAITRFASIEELQRTVTFNETFTAMLGHDLRNPLAAMVMAAQVMLKREDAEPFAKPLNRIVGSGARMARMIDQILDFMRMRLGSTMPIRPEPCDVRALVQQVVGELKDSHPTREIKLESTGDTRGAWDGDRLAQVFSNLVANAVVHGAEPHPVEVNIDGTRPQEVEIRIHNAGTMDPNLVPKLFEPMAGRDRRSAKSRGLGLGLFISYRVMQAHGGTIAVDSAPERGTTLTVTIPRHNGAR